MTLVSILVNGSLGPKFRIECELRQGCPLSPLLFNLVVESFSILVNQFQELGWLEGVLILGLNERIPTLQYADDTLLFFCWSKRLALKIQSYLTILSLISGLKINIHKNVVYDVGRDLQRATSFASKLGCQVGALPMKYLGIPLGGRTLLLCRLEWYD